MSGVSTEDEAIAEVGEAIDVVMDDQDHAPESVLVHDIKCDA